MTDKKCLKTNIGMLTLEINEGECPGVFIKLNDVPILLLEENEDKIIVKNYKNKKVIIDDEYVNLDLFGIDLDEIKNIKEDVLKSLE